MDNITNIGDAPKETYKEFTLKVVYIDGTPEELTCSYYGTSVEREDFMVFLEGPPEDESYSTLLLSTAQIRSIRILHIKEVEYEKSKS